MSGIGKKIGSSGRKSGAAAKAMGNAAVEGAKMAANKITGEESKAQWLVRVITSLPKYLRLYLLLLTDNRVSGKVKVILVTAVTALAAHFAMSGLVLQIQAILAYIVGPFAFVPTVLIILITLDFCYKLIDAEILKEHEREIFGEEDSLEADVKRLREYLGSSYERFVNWWQERAKRAENKMKEDGLIVDGELTEDAIQEVADKIVELETSDELAQKVDENVKLLQSSDKTVNASIEALEHKISEE